MKMRLLPALIATGLLVCAGPGSLAVRAADVHGELPDMGSSAAELISPAQEALYGGQLLGELRRLGMVIEDPVLQDWISSLGQGLAARSDRPEQPFTFFLMRDRAINAFATLGGFVGMNAGLILTADREDEVAAVLAHEISHATQRHIVRSVESAQKDSIPILIGMLGAVIAAQQAGGNADATQAAIMGGMALLQQRQINYTRSNEHEADRIGIGILAKSGHDPMAMADFFAKLQRATRSQGDAVPDFLRSHPVTTTRISEAKDRAEKMQPRLPAPVDHGNAPRTLAGFDLSALNAAQGGPDVRLFAFARERLRVMSARSPAEAAGEYHQRLRVGENLDDATRYGMAVADMLSGKAAHAIDLLQTLQHDHADIYWIDLALAEAHHRAGEADHADRLFESLLRRLPRNPAVALAYAGALSERGTAEAAGRAISVLRPLLNDAGNDPTLHRSFARAAEVAGDLARAAEAHAEAAFLSGRAEDALNQLMRLKERDDLDYVQRARIDARIAAMTPIVLELRARGIRPDGSSRGQREGTYSLHGPASRD